MVRVISEQFDWMGLYFSGTGPNYPLPPPQGVSFTFRMGTLPLPSNTDEITVCVKQNWSCCLPALHGFCQSVQNQDHPEVRPCKSGASRRRGRRTGKTSAVALIWSGHISALFTHACCALGLTGFKDKYRYLCILWNKTPLNVSIFFYVCLSYQLRLALS